MSLKTRFETKKNKPGKPNLLTQLRDKTVSKKERPTLLNKNVPDIETLKNGSNNTETSPTPDNTSETTDNMETEDTPPSPKASTTLGAPSSPTAAEKGKNVDNENSEIQQTAANTSATELNTNQPPLIDDALYEKIMRRTPYKAATLFANIKEKTNKQSSQKFVNNSVIFKDMQEKLHKP